MGKHRGIAYGDTKLPGRTLQVGGFHVLVQRIGSGFVCTFYCLESQRISPGTVLNLVKGQYAVLALVAVDVLLVVGLDLIVGDGY